MGQVGTATRQEQNRALGMSTLAFTTCFAVWTIFSIIGVRIKQDLGLDDTEFGLLIGTPILTGSLSRLLLGIWADQYGGRIVFPLVMILAAAATLLLTYATTYDAMLLAGLGIGLAGGSFAVGVAYGYSVAVVIGLRGPVFFWGTPTLIDVMLVGHWIEMRSIMGASGALEALVRLLPSVAHRLGEDGPTSDLPVSELSVGDRVLVKPGEKVPVDGVIREGRSNLNEAMLTGESRPVERGVPVRRQGGVVHRFEIGRAQPIEEPVDRLLGR